MMRLRHAILACALLCPPATASAHIEGGKVYCMDKNGSDVVRVSSGTGNVTGPTWKPDGSDILYVATGEGHGMHDYEGSRLLIVSLPGLETRQIELPPGVLGARSPAWKPDGTQILFVGRSATSPDIGHNDLYLTNLSDGTTANLTNGSIPFIGMPVWSSDGDRIAITAGIGEEWNLLVLEADGRSAPDTVLSMKRPILNLSWSPDGNRFALQCLLEDNFEICVLNADGTGLVNISNHPAFDADPAWSPDGTEILFVSDRNGGNQEIFCMAADGSSVTRLTVDEGTDVEPAWSSDGKICFVSDRGAEQEATAP